MTGRPEEAAGDSEVAPRGRLWTRLGLRARVTLTFGLGALLVSASMGGLSYFTTRHFLVSERQNASLHQAYVNGQLVRNTLHSGKAEPDQLLASADSGTAGSHSVLYYQGTWYARSLSVGPQPLSRCRCGDWSSREPRPPRASK